VRGTGFVASVEPTGRTTIAAGGAPGARADYEDNADTLRDSEAPGDPVPALPSPAQAVHCVPTWKTPGSVLRSQNG